MAILDFLKPKNNEPASAPMLPQVPLRQLIDGERRAELLVLLSHLRGSQHTHKRYDWDARLIFGSDSLVDVPIDQYVPMKRRQPCVSLRLGKVIVKRLTTMVFGHDRFPMLTINGDAEAEDFVQELAKMSKLRTKMVEARDKGGACGSVILSWGFVDGKPVIDVHSAPLIDVLEWADFENRKPGKVLKAYDFRKQVYRPDGRPETKTFWQVRYWDEEVDISWEPIPDDVAATTGWQSWPSKTIRHGHGSCPMIWVQNIADSDETDGICDADGQHADFDEMDRLASATERGTILNVDPTLVIRDHKGKDETVIRKGSGTVIYSPGGAEYLELNGSAVEASKSLLQSIKQSELDEAEVVLLDPEKLSGAGVSAAALKVRYAPMLAKCDLLRDQYGEAIIEVLRVMLETAKRLQEVSVDEEGVRYWSKVEMEPRIERVEPEEGEEAGVLLVERTPGTSENISLKWPPYFPATWQDMKDGVETAKNATGGQQLLSQRAGVELIAPMLDIDDVDDELGRIEEDQNAQSDRAKAMLELGAPEPPGNPVDEDDEEE